jgi:hypothetical protein
LMTAVPRHQPPLPGWEQVVVPETVAGGNVVVLVVSWQLESPELQLSVPLPDCETEQGSEEQLPGQPTQAVGLKKPLTLPVDGHDPPGE